MCAFEHSDVDESNFVKWKWIIATMIDSCTIQSWSMCDTLQSWFAHDMQGPFKVQSTVCLLFGSNTYISRTSSVKPDRKGACNKFSKIGTILWLSQEEGWRVGVWELGSWRTVSHAVTWLSLTGQTIQSSLDLGLHRHQRSVSTEQPPGSTGLWTCSVKLVFINEQRRIRGCFILIIYVADTLLQKGWVWMTDRPTCWNKAMLQLNQTMWLNSQIGAHYAGWLIVRKKVGYLHKELVTALPESPAGSTLIAMDTSWAISFRPWGTGTEIPGRAGRQ